MEEELAKLRARNAELEQLNAQLGLVISHLEERLTQLETDSNSSHKPPSTDNPKQRANRRKRQRKKSPRKRGGQPGHEGKTRRMAPSDQVDRVQNLVLDTCPCCQETMQLDHVKPIVHQVDEIPIIKPHITEFRLHQSSCTSCGHAARAGLPQGISLSRFGPRASALLTFLRTESRLSIKRTQLLAKSLFGLSISTGAISNLDGRSSQLLKADHEELHEAIKQEVVLNLDETTWYLKGERQVIWCATSPLLTYLQIRKHRGQREAKELIGEDFSGICITDRYCGYHWLEPSKRQMCLAHLVRDFRAMSLQPGPLSLTGWMLENQARKLLGWWAKVRDGTMSRDQLAQNSLQLSLGLEQLLEEAVVNGAGSRWSGMGREILKHFESLWTFVENEGVEPTNNSAEQVLRHAVILRKLSLGSWSLRGLRFIERALSVRETLMRQGRDYFQFLVDRYAGHPTSLLPLPT